MATLLIDVAQLLAQDHVQQQQAPSVITNSVATPAAKAKCRYVQVSLLSIA